MIPLTRQELERLQELMLLTIPYLTADGARLLSRLLGQMASGSVDRVDITYFSLLIEDILSRDRAEKKEEMAVVEDRDEQPEEVNEATRAALMSLNNSLVLILDRPREQINGRFIENEPGR